MANTVNVTDDTFDRDVRNSATLVVVAFWAAWCGPCRMFAPILDEVAGEYADVLTVARLDIDANPHTASACQIMGVPTTLVYQHGEPILRLTGAKSKGALVNELANYLS